MPFIEAPTTFYLGRRYDPESHRLIDDVVYYDSRDLTTHAVVVGMTGSGKTGLCVTLLEEAILDNIPAIVIDPKGDITNLLLNFPDLKPEDFQPWVNVDDARRAGMDLPTYAADVAQQWKDGLNSWGIVQDRLRWLQLASKYSIFTPGSDTGLPISILASLKAPRDGWVGNEELLREQIIGITTALLALVGINAEPIKDPEHVLIANIFETAWRQGIDLTLEDIILQVQNPPFDKLGAFPIDQYISEKNRMKMSMQLNNIIAAPSFQSWIQGEPLDIQNLLYQPNGRPRVSIFYTAHLNEQERMFITTLIIQNMLGWMRQLSGTTSLRALLYIDEMFGYFPPYPKNPPTKEPILRLIKQARAFGIGMILATQNPGDLDYKGLSNAGTWFIGRLQSENDKKKVMDGLRSMASADEGMDMQDVSDLIADIEPRVFLMRNIHDTGGPTLIHTRWSMSYLRGPLTRQQIEYLMRDQRQALLAQIAARYGQQYPTSWTQPVAGSPANPPPPNLPSGAPPGLPGMPVAPPGLPGNGGFGAQSAPGFQQGWTQQPTVPPNQVNFPVNPQDSQLTAPGVGSPSGYSQNPPPIPSSTAQYYLPTRMSNQQAIGEWERRTGMQAQAFGGATLVYKPVLLSQSAVRYSDRKANIFTARFYTYAVPDLQKAGLVHWDDHKIEPFDSRIVTHEPQAQAAFGDLPPGLTDSKRLTQLSGEITDLLYNTARLTIPFNPDLKLYGNPDAEFNEFQSKAYQSAREARDAELDKLSAKYGGMMEKMEGQYRSKERELRAEKLEISDRKREELFTTGEALLSLWKGRTNYTLSRMSRASRYRKQTKVDLAESYETLDVLAQEMDDLEQEYAVALQKLDDKWAAIANHVEDYVISAYKKDIQLEIFGIGWLPSWYTNINGNAMMIDAF